MSKRHAEDVEFQEYEPQESSRAPSVDAGVEEDVLLEMKKELIKMALCSELSRTAMNRQTIVKTIVHPRKSQASGRLIKQLLYLANLDLEDKFGMKIIPLPKSETPEQFRGLPAAEANGKNKKRAVSDVEGATRFILTSVLPTPYKQVIPGAKSEAEGIYMGFVAIVVMLISLEGGVLSRSKLWNDYWTAGLGLPEDTPVGSYETLLSKMKRNSYILDHKENDGGDGDTIVWLSLGPRALVEFSGDVIFEMAKDYAPSDYHEKLQTRLAAVFDKKQQK